MCVMLSFFFTISLTFCCVAFLLFFSLCSETRQLFFFVYAAFGTNIMTATNNCSANNFQINSAPKTTDKSVSAEITILANVTDNEARYRCEAHNSATEIPLFESKTLSVHCKFS